MDELVLLAREQMEKSVESLKGSLATVRTGRASAALLDGVMVDYYGEPTPLNQIASVTIPEARQLVIKPYDRNDIKNIIAAINASNLGLTPINDGALVRLNVPALTEERRRELVKQTRKLVEDTKIICRNSRRDAIEDLKKLKKDSKITEDAEASYEKDIQKKLDDISAKIDKLMDDKEKEIMQV